MTQLPLCPTCHGVRPEELPQEQRSDPYAAWTPVAIYYRSIKGKSLAEVEAHVAERFKYVGENVMDYIRSHWPLKELP